MEERYGKGKSSGSQRQPMKNQTPNGMFCFDAIRPTNEEEIPQDLNEEREVGRIFYKEEENTHTCIHKVINEGKKERDNRSK